MSYSSLIREQALAIVFGAEANPGSGGGGEGEPGPRGLPGLDGKSLHSGTTAPANGVGNDGDFYLNTVLFLLHGPKASGAWPSGVSIIGPQGLPGDPGPQGIPGTGPSFTATADEAFVVGQLGYIKANGNAALASATAVGKEAIGFATNNASVGQPVTFKLAGSLITGQTGLAPNAPYFMGTTNGSIVPLGSVPSASGNVLLRIGTALSATVLLFDPETPITL